MNVYKIVIVAIIISAAIAGFATPVYADLFDNPKNLKILPKNITPEELGATMRGFAINTGSRCSSCHVGEKESDLSTYDFSLDDKEKKRKARVMLQMVNDINQSLAGKLGKPAAELVKVDCATCHRGQEKPLMLQDVLTTTYRDKGLDKAIENYRDLRKRYYGGYTYDFSEMSLLTLVGDFAKADETDAALGFINLNLEFYPESVQTYIQQARILNTQGDKSGAQESLRKALEISPDNKWIKQMLGSLESA